MMRCLGVKFQGRALMYPHRLYEHSYVSVADKNIIDGSQITGHYVVYGDVVVGSSNVSGVMHEGSYAANARIVSDESENLRTFIGTYQDLEENINTIAFINGGASGAIRGPLWQPNSNILLEGNGVPIQAAA